MTGGARPLLIWVLLLTLMGALNAIWTGDLIEIATFAAAVFAQLTLITFLVIANPAAVRSGAPTAPVDGRREVLVRGSFAAAFTAIGFATFVFGFVLGHALIYMGAGMALAGSGRLVGEWRAQRQAGAER
jgi:hypothetical protein